MKSKENQIVIKQYKIVKVLNKVLNKVGQKNLKELFEN